MFFTTAFSGFRRATRHDNNRSEFFPPQNRDCYLSSFNTNLSQNNSDTTNTESAEMKTEEQKGTPVVDPSDQCCSCGCFCVHLFSVLVCSVFVLFAFLRTNEDERLQWIIYYSFNAAIPVVLLVSYLGYLPITTVYVLSLVNFVWSITYIVIYSIAVEEWEDLTKYTEDIYDITGASFCLLSSLWHPILVKCERGISMQRQEGGNEEVTAEQV